MSFPILTVRKELSGGIQLANQHIDVNKYKNTLQKEINQLRRAIYNQDQKIQSAHSKKIKQRLLETRKQFEEHLTQREITLVQLNQMAREILPQSSNSLKNKNAKIKAKKQVKQLTTPAIKVNPSAPPSIQAIMKEKVVKHEASPTLDIPFSTAPSSDQQTAQTSGAPLEAALSSPSPSSEITEEKADKSDSMVLHSLVASSKPLSKKEVKWYDISQWPWLKTALVGTAILAGAYFCYQNRSSISASLTRLMRGPTPNTNANSLLMPSTSAPAVSTSSTAANRDSYFSQLYKDLHDTIHYYLKDKGHSLDWLVRHNKISEDLKKWIEEKGKMQKHWNR